MPKSQASKERRRRHKDMPAQIKDNGVRVDLGDVDEIAHHYRRHFHQFLDYLTIDPSAPNPLDQVGDGEPALRDAMRRAGIAGLTRNELLEKRDEYVARLDAGKARYSSKLHRVEWIPAN